MGAGCNIVLVPTAELRDRGHPSVVGGGNVDWQRPGSGVVRAGIPDGDGATDVDDPLEVAWAVLLNGLVGGAAGWLYWRSELRLAIIAHCSGDLVLHMIVPLFTY
jgi:hypothetical protein